MALSYFNLSILPSHDPRWTRLGAEECYCIFVPTPTHPTPYYTLSSPYTSIAGLILCPRLPQITRSQQLRSLVQKCGGVDERNLQLVHKANLSVAVQLFCRKKFRVPNQGYRLKTMSLKSFFDVTLICTECSGLTIQYVLNEK